MGTHNTTAIYINIQGYISIYINGRIDSKTKKATEKTKLSIFTCMSLLYMSTPIHITIFSLEIFLFYQPFQYFQYLHKYIKYLLHHPSLVCIQANSKTRPFLLEEISGWRRISWAMSVLSYAIWWTVNGIDLGTWNFFRTRRHMLFKPWIYSVAERTSVMVCILMFI